MHEQPSQRSWIAQFARGCATVLAAIWIVLEEWIWNSLTALMARLGRLPPLRWLEARIARLPPWAAMAVFLVPVLLLLPAKVLGLWLIGTGRVKSGVAVFIGAKVVGTAVAARLFALTKQSLLTIGWFKRCYVWLTRWRDRLHAFLHRLRIWQRAKAWLAQVRATMRAWYRALLAR